MPDRENNQHGHACPSCGKSISGGFWPIKIGSKVKMLLVLTMLAYVVLSTLLFLLTAPASSPGLYTNRRTVRMRPLPTYALWLQPLAKTPVFQVVVAGGFLLGVGLFYWEWLREKLENWRGRRENPPRKPKSAHRFKCRSCGREWG